MREWSDRQVHVGSRASFLDDANPDAGSYRNALSASLA